MELQDLYELKEVVGRYRTTISELGYSNPSVENIDALHNAIATVDLNEMPELFMRIDTTLKHHIEISLIGCFENLEKDIKNNMPTIRRFDKGVGKVMKFCKTILEELRNGIDTLNNRIATTPDADDISSLDILNDYIDGIFGDMDFNEFVDEFVTDGLFPNWRIERRINYLISATDKEQIKSALSLYLAKRMESKEPQPSPSVEATAKDNATSPDFSHMVSYKPTKPFDMHALYEFLIDEGVIDEIDEPLFTDCISHAHINELWNNNHVIKKRKRNLLQCLFKKLQEYYPRTWVAKCAKNLFDDDTKTKNITNPTTNAKTNKFEDKLLRVLQGKAIK